MANILFAWELGGGAGHVHIVGPLAAALHERGHRVFLAARDLQVAHGLLGDSGLELLPAPFWTGKVGGLPPAASFPEVLLRVGYLDPSVLDALVRGWRNLFALTGCELVVAEHAPTAMLAANIDRRPRVLMGTGFTVPPAAAPMPALEAGRSPPAQRLANAERAVLDSLNEVCVRFSHPPFACVSDFLTARDTFLCTVAELDHYQSRRGPAEYLGPLSFAGHFETPEWPEAPGPRVFAYLHPGYGQFGWVAKALADAACPTLLVAPGVRARTISQLSTETLAVRSAPVDIAAAADGAAVVLSHSSHGTVWNVMRRGTPQLLIPAYVEQAALGCNVARSGAALLLGAEEKTDQFHEALSCLTSDPRYRLAAETIARRHAGFDEAEQVARLTVRVESAVV